MDPVSPVDPLPIRKAPWYKPRGSVSDNLRHKWLINKNQRRSPELCLAKTPSDRGIEKKA